MWGFLLNLIGGPIVTGIISAYKAKLAAQNTQDAQAADLAKAEIMGEISAFRARLRALGPYQPKPAMQSAEAVTP